MKRLFENQPQQFTSIIEKISDMIIILEVQDGPEFTYNYLNEKAKIAFDLDASIIGKTIIEIFDDKKGDYIRKQYVKVMETGKSLLFELERPNGWTGETQLNPIKNESGEITHIFSITRDITDKNELKNTLLQKTMELELVWNHTSDAIFIMKEDGSIYRRSS